MAVVNGYTSVTEVRDELADTGSKLDVDLLERAINTASRAVDWYCSSGVPGTRKFWLDATVTTRTFQVDDPKVAWIDDIGSSSGVIVKKDDNDDGTFETTLTVGTDYQLEPLNQGIVAAGDTAMPYAFWKVVLLGDNVFTWYEHRPALQVTAKYGWSSIPAEINRACILLAVKLFMRKGAPFALAGAGDFGAVRIVQSDPDVKMLLQPYVKERPRSIWFMPQRNSIFHQRWT